MVYGCDKVFLTKIKPKYNQITTLNKVFGICVTWSCPRSHALYYQCKFIIIIFPIAIEKHWWLSGLVWETFITECTSSNPGGGSSLSYALNKSKKTIKYWKRQTNGKIRLSDHILTFFNPKLTTLCEYLKVWFWSDLNVL